MDESHRIGLGHGHAPQVDLDQTIDGLRPKSYHPGDPFANNVGLFNLYEATTKVRTEYIDISNRRSSYITFHNKLKSIVGEKNPTYS